MTERLPPAFAAALAGPAPPPDWPAPLAALWWIEAEGTGPGSAGWERAHRLVQDEPGPEAAWVHAHLHRIEGDPANAGYWYRRAGRAASGEAPPDERAAIVRALSGP